MRHDGFSAAASSAASSAPDASSAASVTGSGAAGAPPGAAGAGRAGAAGPVNTSGVSVTLTVTSDPLGLLDAAKACKECCAHACGARPLPSSIACPQRGHAEPADRMAFCYSSPLASRQTPRRTRLDSSVFGHRSASTSNSDTNPSRPGPAPRTPLPSHANPYNHAPVTEQVPVKK